MTRVSPPIGVYWGRFKPPHKGRMSVIRRFRRTCHLVVAIGSSERKNTKSEPFSGRERRAMMEAYLKEELIRGVTVVALRDGNQRFPPAGTGAPNPGPPHPPGSLWPP